jgi:hypothetical protein
MAVNKASDDIWTRPPPQTAFALVPNAPRFLALKGTAICFCGTRVWGTTVCPRCAGELFREFIAGLDRGEPVCLD